MSSSRIILLPPKVTRTRFSHGKSPTGRATFFPSSRYCTRTGKRARRVPVRLSRACNIISVTNRRQKTPALSTERSLCSHAGIPGQHSGSIASLASANYYGSATSGPEQHSPAKYPENGHDTLSDFVTFVCQEAESSQGAQVRRRRVFPARIP